MTTNYLTEALEEAVRINTIEALLPNTDTATIVKAKEEVDGELYRDLSGFWAEAADDLTGLKARLTLKVNARMTRPEDTGTRVGMTKAAFAVEFIFINRGYNEIAAEEEARIIRRREIELKRQEVADEAAKSE